MRLSKIRSPISTTYWQYAELRDDDSGANGSRDFFGCLNAQSHMSLGVTNDNNSLESSALTGSSLLLDRLDL